MAYDTQTQPKYSHEGFQSITASVYLPPIQPKSVNEPQRQPSNGTPKQRRRKTIRACNHCQKSHLTCDDSRPCARCIKKGTGSTCVDGARKKAKYLLEAEELLESSGEKQPKVKKPRRIASKGGGSTNGTKTIEKSPDNRSHEQQQQQNPEPLPASTNNNGMAAFAAALVPSPSAAVPASNFGSEAVNLEYAFLTNMLSYPLFSNANHQQPPAAPGSANGSTISNEGGNQPASMLGADATIAIPSSLWPAPIVPATGQPQDTGGAAWHQHGRSFVQHDPNASHNGGYYTQHGISDAVQPSPPPHAQIVTDDTFQHYNQQPTVATSGPAVHGLNPLYTQNPADVYSRVTEPYKYYNGFHFFFRHISGRMDKQDIMRISRAIAHFRPSLVALLRNLTREDLIFMEKSFQRALMEYEKLVGFIGTPTVVWRRSGEIALVGKEFSILTQWDRQQLTAGSRFIFELMDSQSAIEYWEQFAVHAFENSEHTVMSECRLLRPDGGAVPCTFSFTIKRDLFGIPMAIIGNFLPIL